MPKYNRNVRTKKYADAFNSTEVLLPYFESSHINTFAEYPSGETLHMANEGKIVIDKRQNVVKKPKKLKREYLKGRTRKTLK